jgi:hypothetical protein
MKIYEILSRDDQGEHVLAWERLESTASRVANEWASGGYVTHIRVRDMDVWARFFAILSLPSVHRT